MKRILLGLTTLGVIAGVTLLVTNAFFSDTETSTGNVFQAGAIDLKVDHKYAMYDGNECTTNCVENTGTNLIQNGSFEVPEVTDPAQWEIFPSGTAGLVWTVEWNGGSASYNSRTRPEPSLVEYHEGVLGSAQDGDQYTELDSDWFGPNDPLNGEPALIKIYQNIATTPGSKYKLHYYFSPRPNQPDTENILYVNIDNVLVQTQGPVAGGGSIVWSEYTYEFTATGVSTKVEFIGGGTNNSLGVFLDNVSVHPYDCDYQIIGGTCTLWEKKDLGEGDRFWNFGDVKPGDYGINIISLHAFDNDAFACLTIGDIVDSDNTLTEPETALSDTLDNGELSPFIRLFIWEDSTQNNIYDVGETILLPANSPLTAALNPAIALQASNTKYFGIAWCAGDQSVVGNVISCDGSSMGNIAQTDSTTASLTAYAEQQRNNPDFSCNPAEN
jgi:predicted ribosomally synthesized peptide with SipW-like signal peptide